jgi:hypothetical protein
MQMSRRRCAGVGYDGAALVDFFDDELTMARIASRAWVARASRGPRYGRSLHSPGRGLHSTTRAAHALIRSLVVVEHTAAQTRPRSRPGSSACSALLARSQALLLAASSSRRAPAKAVTSRVTSCSAGQGSGFLVTSQHPAAAEILNGLAMHSTVLCVHSRAQSINCQCVGPLVPNLPPHPFSRPRQPAAPSRSPRGLAATTPPAPGPLIVSTVVPSPHYYYIPIPTAHCPPPT